MQEIKQAVAAVWCVFDDDGSGSINKCTISTSFSKMKAVLTPLSLPWAPEDGGSMPAGWQPEPFASAETNHADRGAALAMATTEVAKRGTFERHATDTSDAQEGQGARAQQQGVRSFVF